MAATVQSALEISQPATVPVTSWVISASTVSGADDKTSNVSMVCGVHLHVYVCVCEQGDVRATASTKVHVSRVKMAPRCAAALLSTSAPRVRLINVTIVVTASVSPATALYPQGTSPAGKCTCALVHFACEGSQSLSSW